VCVIYSGLYTTVVVTFKRTKNTVTKYQKLITDVVAKPRITSIQMARFSETLRFHCDVAAWKTRVHTTHHALHVNIVQASCERFGPLCRQRHLSVYRSRTRTRTLTLFLTLTRTLNLKDNKNDTEI